MINGLKVLGSTEALPALVPALGIEQVIITIADAPEVQLRWIVNLRGDPGSRADDPGDVRRRGAAAG